MKCEDVRENLWLYDRNELPAGLKNSITSHLEHCAACTEEIGQFRQVEAALDSLPGMEPSPFFDQRLDMRLDELQSRPDRLSLLTLWLKDQYVWTFAVLLVLTTGLWLGFRHQQNRELDSMEAVLKLEDKYLGQRGDPVSKPAPELSVSHNDEERSSETVKDELANSDAPIPEGDLAVVENLDLLENYELVKQLDLDYSGTDDPSETKVN